jgi:hypothetical protein
MLEQGSAEAVQREPEKPRRRTRATADEEASATGNSSVATRELRWMRRDRLALFLAIGVPIIAFAILAATFSNAVVRNLRVSIVDADRSPTSLIYVQAVASAPGVLAAIQDDESLCRLGKKVGGTR